MVELVLVEDETPLALVVVGDVGEGPEMDTAPDDEEDSVDGFEKVRVKPGSEMSMSPKD